MEWRNETYCCTRRHELQMTFGDGAAAVCMHAFMHERAVASEQQVERGVCLSVVGCSHRQMIRALPPTAVDQALADSREPANELRGHGHSGEMMVGVELFASDVLCRHDLLLGCV